MKIKQNCENTRCRAKNSMDSIFTIEYYKKSYNVLDKNGEKIDKTYPTHKDISAFYICKKCTYMSNFRLEQLRVIGAFWVYLIPKNDYELLNETRKKNHKECIYCGQNQDPVFPSQGEKVKPTILKLYLRSTRDYLGYFCSICRVVYGMSIPGIDWKNADTLHKDPEPVNVLSPLNNIIHKLFTKKELENHPYYDKETEQLIRYVEFIKIGGWRTIEGAPTGNENIEYHNVGFPKRTVKRLLKMLEKRGCEIN